MLNALDKGTCS